MEISFTEISTSAILIMNIYIIFYQNKKINILERYSNMIDIEKISKLKDVEVKTIKYEYELLNKKYQEALFGENSARNLILKLTSKIENLPEYNKAKDQSDEHKNT